MSVAGKKFLVTGGSGFIGSALVKRLVARGANVRVFDNHSRGAMRRLAEVEDRIECVDGDIREPKAVLHAAAGCDSLIHLAYLNGTEFFYTKPELVLEIGVKGMMNTLEAAMHHGIKEFVLASSSEVYQTPPVIPTPETVPLIVPDISNPRYSYGGGKIISELLAVNYGRRFFERMVIFRPHNVYGPDMGWEHVIPQMILRAKKAVEESAGDQVDFAIQGDGEETRAFIYIDDFIDGIMRVIEAGAHNEIYHVGTDREARIIDLAAQIVQRFGRRPRFRHLPLSEGSTRRRCPDITKLRALGFNPRTKLAEGLDLVVPWYRENAHLCPSTSFNL